MGQPQIGTWQEMKAKLREKYMPSNYYNKLGEQLFNLKQGSMTVAEYTQLCKRFDELKTGSQIVELHKRSNYFYFSVCLGQFCGQGYFGNFEDFMGMGCKSHPWVVLWVKIFIRVFIYVSFLVLNRF